METSMFFEGLFGLLALVVFTAPLRRQCITLFVFRFFKKAMPPFSQTEKAALLAGKVGEEKTLLYKPNWKKIFPDSTWGKLTKREERYLNGPVNKLCRMVDDYKISQIREIPKEVWDFMRKIQIFAMNIRRNDGGLGFSKTAQAKVFVKIASRSFSVAVVCMVPNSLGPAELLHHYGTRAQKLRFLPGLASGETIPAFALTESGAGSDAGAMQSMGVVYRGEDGKPWMRLNWAKRFITLGPVCTLLGLAFKLSDPEHILGSKENIGITVALIPINEETKSSGVSIGRFHDPLGASFPNGPNYGKDVCLPIDEYVIGGVEQAGKGWEMLMECLSTGRFVSLPSVSVGGAKLACFSVGAYARIRKQFNTPISNFGGIEEFLGKMVGLTYLMESTLCAGTGIVDTGGTSPVLSAIAKYHTTSKLKEVLNLGMEILGGKGIMLGLKNFLARIHSMVEIAITVEGANILTRNMIIFGQGFIRCHPWLLKEMMALEISDPKEALCEFDKAFVMHVGYVLKIFFRACFHACGGWRWSDISVNNKTVRAYYGKMNRMSSALALVSEATLILLGGKLKMEERISARLGDVLSYLYQGGAVLKRFTDVADSNERALMEWSLQYSLCEMQDALVGVLENFPSRSLGRILMRIIFPFGKPHTRPSDALEKKLAHIVTDLDFARDAVIGGIYEPPIDNLDDNLALLSYALGHIIFVTAPIEQRLKEAKKTGTLRDARDYALAVQKGIITEQEMNSLKEGEALSARVAAVDDFDVLK
jgi:acyl-CoA dehydrogenase